MSYLREQDEDPREPVPAWWEPPEQASEPPPPPVPLEAAGLRVVTIDDFASVEEEGAQSLLGGVDDALIPAGGDVMFYGDGGAGKTTLCVDLACHLGAGDDWLGIHVVRPLRVLLVENEGPRAFFRKKLRRKLDGWTGSPIEGRVTVLEQPWGQLTFDDDRWCDALALAIAAGEIDVVILGPVSRLGMNEAGTLQEVRDFMVRVGSVRKRSERPVTFALVHHENKTGKVSGAFEGSGDTLLHVLARGHGKTRLFVQKARWASTYHQTALELVWTGGEGFAVVDKPELDDDAIAELILSYAAEHPGGGWTNVEKNTLGVEKKRRNHVRDGLFAGGKLVNVAKDESGQEILLDRVEEKKRARLHFADDPTIQHLRRERGADAAQTLIEVE